MALYDAPRRLSAAAEAARDRRTREAAEAALARLSGRGLTALAQVRWSARWQTVSLRDNALRSLAGFAALPALRVLDVSTNALETVAGLPPLPGLEVGCCIFQILLTIRGAVLQELHLTGNALRTLCGFPQLPELQVLSISGNQLRSLAGLPPLPNLRALFASDNDLRTFEGNPVARSALCGAFAVAVVGEQLEQVDGVAVGPECLAQAQAVLGRPAIAAREGMPLPDSLDRIADHCSAFLDEKQFSNTRRTACKFSTGRIEGEFEEQSELKAVVNFACEHVHKATSSRTAGGACHYQWFRVDRHGYTRAIAYAARREYTPCTDDIGSCLILQCRTWPPQGQQPSLVYLVTEAIRAVRPSVDGLRIAGELVEDATLEACYSYSGGVEGRSLLHWVKTASSGATEIIATGPTCRLRECDIGACVTLECTPVRSDGVRGPVQMSATAGPVQPIKPVIHGGTVRGRFTEGERLVIQLGRYEGKDVEGTHLYKWHRVQEDGAADDVPDAVTDTYLPCLEDVGASLLLEITPVDCRGVQGDVVTVRTQKISPAKPQVLTITMTGKPEEGEALEVTVEYFGGVEGKSTIQWLRRDPSSEETVAIPHARKRKYTARIDDVGYYLVARYTPVRSDGATGDPTQATTLSPVRAALPRARVAELAGLPATECADLRARPEYFGGRPGRSLFGWQRSCAAPVLWADIPSAAGSLVYAPRAEDVGRRLRFWYAPRRMDDVQGDTVFAETDAVQPAQPRAVHVSVRVESRQMDGLPVLAGSAAYVGGTEGASFFSWERLRPDGACEAIAGACARTYAATREDEGCRLVFRYTPARVDGAVGPAASSAPTDPIHPRLPRVAAAEVSGEACEGCEVRCRATFEDAAPQRAAYEWQRSGELAPDVFEPLPGAPAGPALVLRPEDTGYHIRALVTPRDAQGRTGAPTPSTATALVQSLPPRAMMLDVRCTPSPPTNRSVVRAVPVYAGGREGRSLYAWERRAPPSTRFAPVAGQARCEYACSVDDVGCELRVTYTPVRDDGAVGSPVCASTERVRADEALLRAARALVASGAVRVELPYPEEHVVDADADGRRLRVTRASDGAQVFAYERFGGCRLAVRCDDDAGLSLDDGVDVFRAAAAGADERDVAVLALRMLFDD
eukprot:m51a1_g8882 hypothetical protein (1141) ;mRNA; r:644686-648971